MLEERVRTWMAASIASTEVMASTMRMAVSRRVDTLGIPFPTQWPVTGGIASGSRRWSVTLRRARLR
jgi:hypothetical protein